jgi:hypothetical protein
VCAIVLELFAVALVSETAKMIIYSALDAIRPSGCSRWFVSLQIKRVQPMGCFSTEQTGVCA